MPINVLYIDGDGPLGGASRSLFEAVRSLPKESVIPYFLASRGTALEFYRQVAQDMVVAQGMPKFDHTRYGYYRGVRWLILLRELYYFPFMLAAVFKARRRWKKIDIVHLNEFVYIIPALVAKWLFKARLVVHVRALARGSDGSLRTRVMNRIFARQVDAVIAIDGNVRATLSSDLPVNVINNSFTPNFSNSPEDFIVEKIQSLDPESLKVGFVGNLHRSKGVFEILNAAEIVKDAGRKVDFIMVGGVTVENKGLKAWFLSKAGFAQNVREDLLALVDRKKLRNLFYFLGPTLSIKYVYDHLDVLLFPSHFDAPGRPVFEAGFSGVPSIVAANNPTPDTFVHRETGLAISANNPSELAEAIVYFADNPGERRRMGENARRLAMENFDPKINSKKLHDVYVHVLSDRK